MFSHGMVQSISKTDRLMNTLVSRAASPKTAFLAYNSFSTRSAIDISVWRAHGPDLAVN